MPRSRLRRVANVVLKAALIVLGVAVAAVLALILLLGTDWGREQVRRRLEARLDAAVHGDVSIGRIERVDLPRVTAADVVVRDAAGREVLALDRVALRLDVPELLRGRFHAHALSLVSPRLVARRDAEGRFDLARLLRPGPPGEPMPVRIDELRVVGGVVRLELPDRTITLDGLGLEGRVASAGRRIEVDVDRLDAVWRERGAAVHLEGRVRRDGDAVQAHGLVARVGEAWAEAPLLTWRPGEGALSAIGRVARGEDGPFEVALSRPRAEAPWSVRAQGALRGFALEAQGTLAGTSLATLRGDLRVAAAGELGALGAGTVVVDARPAGGLVRFEGEVEAARVRATAAGTLALRDGVPRVTAARVRGRIEDERGTAAFDAAVEGAWPALAVTGTADVRRLAVDSLRAPRAHARYRLEQVPRAVQGTVVLGAPSARWGGQALGPTTARARIQPGGRVIDLEVDVGGPPGAALRDLVPVEVSGTGAARIVRGPGGRTRIILRRLTLRTRGLVWRARGGEVALGPGDALVARDLVLESAAGRIEVEGRLDDRGARRAAGRLHVHGVRLDLGALRAALSPGAPPLRGRVSFDAHVTRRRGVLALDAHGEARRVAWRADAPPIDGRFEGVAAEGHLRVSAEAEGAELGRASLELEATAPRDPFDVAGWRRLGDRAIREARLELQAVDLEAAAALAGRRGRIAGRLDASIRAHDGARRIDLELDATALRTRRLRGLDLRLRGALAGDTLVAGFDTMLLGRPFASGSLSVDVSVDALAARGLAALATAPARATAVTRDFPLALARRALRLEQAVAGRLHATASLTGTPARPIVAIEAQVDDARAGGVRFAEIALTGRLDADGVSGRAVARQRRGGELAVRARLGHGPAGALDARLEAHRFDLAFLAVAISGAGGRLDGELRLGGTRTAPAVSGVARVGGGHFVLAEGARPVRDLRLDAVAEGGVLTARLSARSGEGSIRIGLRGTIDGLVPRTIAAEVDARDLGVWAGRVLAAVTVRGRIEGAGGPDGWRLQATAREATIRLPRETRGELQRVGPLEDVVFVDRRGRARRRAELARAARAARRPWATLHLETPAGVVVRGPDVTATVRATLDIAFAPGETSITGTAEAPSGDVDLFGRRYRIERASAAFDGASPPDPRLDLLLSHEFDVAEIFVQVDGTLRRPRLTLSSDPAGYDRAQLLGFVLGGEPDDPVLARRNPRDRAVGVASTLLASRVQSLVEQALPIDVLRFEVEKGLTSPTRVTVGKWITEDVFLAYRHRFQAQAMENLNEATLEWRFRRRWLIEAHVGDRGTGAADILWTTRF